MNLKNVIIFLIFIFLLYWFTQTFLTEKEETEKPVEVLISGEKITITPETKREMLVEKCGETHYFRSFWDCWEPSDSIYCGSLSDDMGCCSEKTQCWAGERCWESDVLDAFYPNDLCFEGKWDLCWEEDLCKTRGSYWCDGENWVKSKLGICESKGKINEENGNIEENSECPPTEFLRGEWNCWQNSDHKNCELEEFDQGCCTGLECFFADQCMQSDKPLSENSEWFCFEGKWDLCLEADECFRRGTYYCHNGAWQTGIPSDCE